MDHSYSVLSGDTCPNSKTAEGWKAFDHIISNFLIEQKVPGASVAISKKGIILYQQCYGVAGGGRRVHADSMFRIASISKPVTAAIVIRLFDKLKMSLNTKVFGRTGILKSYRTRDKRMKNITIRHLLHHSAGWDRDKVGDAVFVRPQCVIKEHPDSQTYNSALLAYALRRKLQFSPGTWHSYSNLGYLILGEVVETLSGQPFHHVMKRFLQDLDIHNIIVGKKARAHWTSKEVEYFNNREPQVTDSIYPGEGEVLPQYGGMAMQSSASYGGLVSDTASLLKFMHCMEESFNQRNTDGGTSHASNVLWESRCEKSSRLVLEQSDKFVGSYFNSCDMLCQTDLTSVIYDNVEFHSYNLQATNSKYLISEQDPNGDMNNMEINNQELLQVSNPTCNRNPQFLQVCDHTCNRNQESLQVANPTISSNEECVQVFNDMCNRLTKSLLTDLQVRETLSRPDYENGCEWYGLGWDVQDNGRSWGHTGGMEGSCGTLFHHQSGLNWIFLQNSWTVDSDLNGLIKCATCTVPQLQIYNKDVLNCDNDLSVRIVTCDQSQIICLYVSEAVILKTLSDIKTDGYFITWISYMSQDISCVVKGLLQRSRRKEHVEENMTESDKHERKYVVVFQKYHVKEYFIVFNKTVAELNTCIHEYKKEKYVICFLDSFVDTQSQLKYTAIFKYEDCCCDTVVLLAVKATDYVKCVKSYITSHNVTVQSVTDVSGELYVSSVLTSRINFSEPTDVIKDNKTQTYQDDEIKDVLRNAYSRPGEICRDVILPCNDLLKVQHYSQEISCGSSTETSFLESNNNESFGQNLTKTSLESIKRSNNVHSLKQTVEGSTVQSRKSRKSNLRTSTKLNSIYWVQISPESFLTELNKQIQRKNGLVYAKFYTSDAKPYVSGCWLSQNGGNCYQRITMSKYGLVPELVEAASKNIHLQCLSEYMEEDGTIYYAAIWLAG